MSSKGECFVTADGGEVPNEGQITCPNFSICAYGQPVRVDSTWQMADGSIQLLEVGLRWSSVLGMGTQHGQGWHFTTTPL